MLILLAPQVRLELTTLRLTAECSAIELLRSVVAPRLEANLKIRKLTDGCQGKTGVGGVYGRYLQTGCVLGRAGRCCAVFGQWGRVVSSSGARARAVQSSSKWVRAVPSSGNRCVPCRPWAAGACRVVLRQRMRRVVFGQVSTCLGAGTGSGSHDQGASQITWHPMWLSKSG